LSGASRTICIAASLVSLLAPGSALFAEPAGQAQRLDDFDDFSELSLESLLDPETSVATRGLARALRDTPGTVSVITREEIQRSGARDLVDLLAMVPGFQFGVDALSAHAAAVRGLWAGDGRSMLLLDGHDLAELAYNGALLGNRIPVDWLERVEIIRGPASLAYGGGAELAVVNLITRETQGLRVSAAYGQMMHGLVADGAGFGETLARRSLSVAWGQAYPELHDLRVRLGLHVGQGQRSDREYRDVDPDNPNHITRMPGAAAADPLMLRAGLAWRGLELSYLFERYHTTFRDLWGGRAIDVSLPADFTTSSLILAYDLAILPGLHLKPGLRHVWQKPWETTDERARDHEDAYWNLSMHRVQLGLPLTWTPIEGGRTLERLSVLAGFEYLFDWAEDPDFLFVTADDAEQTTPTVSLHNLAGYAQVLLDTPWLNASAGLRYEWHSRSGDAFVPRVALQKAFGDFHFKALYAQSFRAPPIYDFATFTRVVAERATAYELELGYQILESLQVLLNGFDLTIDRPRVYGVEEADRPRLHVGTRGFELELRFRHRGWLADLSYSFYDVVGKNNAVDYAVPGKKHVLLGMAPHKLTFQAGVKLIEKLSLHTSLWVLSDQRYAYTTLLPEGGQRLEELPWQVLWNAYLRYDGLFAEGLWLGFGVYNILNQKVWYPQAYDARHPPYPGGSLEILLRLGYELPL
jgi:outer membrane receptor protein involved in Fe transport